MPWARSRRWACSRGGSGLTTSCWPSWRTSDYAASGGEETARFIGPGVTGEPCRHNPGGGTMPQVVQPRLETGAVGAPHPGVFPKSLEILPQPIRANGRPVAVEKKGGPVVGRRVCPAPPACVIGQHLGQVPADGDQ